MKYVLIVLAVLTLAGCQRDTSAKDEIAKAKKLTCSAATGGGRIERANMVPDTPPVDRRSAGCVLEYLATFDENTIDGTEPTPEMKQLCTSIAQAATVAKADFQKGNPLKDELAFLAENRNPMVARSLAKVVSYVYSNPKESADSARKNLEKKCLANPRSFYLIHGDEVAQYRVVGGARLPEPKTFEESVDRCVEEAVLEVVEGGNVYDLAAKTVVPAKGADGRFHYEVTCRYLLTR